MANDEDLTYSLDSIEQKIYQLTHLKPMTVVAIGGCSRSGKSWLTAELIKRCRKNELNTLDFKLDAWIISEEKRLPHSTVLERYECDRMVDALHRVMQGNPIFPPIYDPKTRKRTADQDENPLHLTEGVIFVEGVLALALEALRTMADLKLFVQISEQHRLERLFHFYRHTKALTDQEAAAIIQEREKEEVPFIQATSLFADKILNKA